MKRFFNSPVRDVLLVLLTLFVFSLFHLAALLWSYNTISEFLETESLIPTLDPAQISALDTEIEHIKLIFRNSVITSMLNAFASLVLFFGILRKYKIAYYGCFVYLLFIVFASLQKIIWFYGITSFGTSIVYMAISTYGILRLYQLRNQFTKSK